MAEPRRTRPSPGKCVAATLGVVLVVVFIVLMIWLFLHPSKLHFSVDHAAATGFNFTATGALTGAFNLTLRSYNWNERAKIYYKSMEVGVWYDGAYVAGGHAPGFLQPPENETRVDVAAQAAPGPLPSDVEEAAKRERTGGKLTVDVHVRAKARFRYGVVSTRRYTVRASCPGVVVDFDEPTTFHRVYCHVHI
ncbi:hypothetical protein PR202_ga02243 [Eleusine coracana subsp. coracana]|uniref:Late embryogenesis abundant protein LEA-2 subgroup domain-containing protein n=1 Tax=Eleusine coracana subsp. coracana TaxID=191504 RepID=A0AAV5BKU2_ELECO|nr:hypothetical protein QOZ80_2AG0140210 [Eleusine coracana subsp. coracana]GJM86389.1 hypothetical protein PR202_ga02243 [Eleusine coracana subsp. coracana]